jgi:hypothetical protein
VTVMAPQWQLERIEVSVAAILSRIVQAGVCQTEYVRRSLAVCECRLVLIDSDKEALGRTVKGCL